MSSENGLKGGAGQRRGLPRGRILLAVSLALNLLVVGVVIGGVLTHDPRPPKPAGASISIGPLSHAFSKEDREALRHALEEQGPSMRDLRSALEADTARLVTILRTEPWDAQAASAVLADMRGRFEQRGALGERLILERVGAMTAQERLDVAERLEQRRQRREEGRPSKD
jgi:uncharacterized membrane protein